MKEGFYFPHFEGSRNDRKIKRLRKELGAEGYAIYFMILEVLRGQPEYRYPVADVDLLADDFDVSEVKIQTVLSKYDLFVTDPESNFFSHKFIENMQPYEKMKEQRRSAGLKSGEKRKQLAIEKATTVERPLNEIEQSKVKESIVKESKVEESKEKENKQNNEIGCAPTPFQLFFELEKNSKLLNACLNWFTITELSNPNKFQKIHNLLYFLHTNNSLELFETQFRAYWSYKNKAKEKTHSFDTFWGTFEEKLLDGGWNSENWTAKLERYEAQNTSKKDLMNRAIEAEDLRLNQLKNI